MTSTSLPPREKIPVEDTWNIASIFPDQKAWKRAYTQVEKEIPTLSQYKGHLTDSPQTLLEWLQVSNEFKQKLSRVNMYTALNFSVDATNQEFAAMDSMATGLQARGQAALAFEEPEIMSIGAEKLKIWMEREPQLAIYSHYFDCLIRQKAHIRSAEVEELLGQLTDPLETATATHNILANADLVFEPAMDVGGKSHNLSHSNIDVLMASRDRHLRRTAYENYADAHLSFGNTMANCLSVGVKRDVFISNARRYTTTLEASLANSFLPIEIYTNVIDTFRAHLPVWHRYWSLCKRVLKLDDIHVYDTRADLSEETPAVDYDQAVNWITAGVRPLGKEYSEIMHKGATDWRWVDRYPNKGKRFGAFSAGMKGTQPFIMLSFDNRLTGVSALAHELGHSMHSYLAWQIQPYIYSSYSLFVAEVASNFHQALVRAYMLDHYKDRDFQIAVLEEGMSNFHRYFFIMPSLAIFDLEIHRRVEKGEALTAEYLTNLMADIFEEGYGPEVVIDRDRTGSVWMQFSSHLYSNYYTYQYTTGISAAHALAENILAGDEDARERYLQFLKSGDSLYPLDALKLAGVDLSSPKSVEKTFQVLSDMIDRLEHLLR
jgi:oligoendopeptidase F